MLRDKIEVTVKGKDAFSFINKELCNLLNYTFPIYIWSNRQVTCTALDDLHIYSKHILPDDEYYYISEKHTKSKWYTIRIWECTFNKLIITMQWQVQFWYQISACRDACKLLKVD